MAEDERLRKKLYRIAKRIHADNGALDSLVIDAKCIQANRINNKGIKAQIQYLFKLYGYKQVKRWMFSEVKKIRRFQSGKHLVMKTVLKEYKQRKKK